MALKFQGDRSVGVLNDPKNTFNTDDLFRVYDGGILVAGGVSVDHGDFVSWDGTKWEREDDIKIANSNEVSQQSSNIAPNYIKKTYEANSYVMQDGVLYTNPNAIGTAEDWNPAHWTQTTVAEMMAGAGDSGYTQVNITLGKNDPKVIPVGQKEDIYVECDPKFTDILDLQIAEDCTDAVIRLKRVSAEKFQYVNAKRGNTYIPIYGKSIVTQLSIDRMTDGNQLMLSANWVGEHGEGYYDVPNDFSEVIMNSTQVVSNVTPKNVDNEFNSYAADSWVFVVKGRAVMCLPD
jgi:hypothetical protein